MVTPRSYFASLGERSSRIVTQFEAHVNEASEQPASSRRPDYWFFELRSSSVVLVDDFLQGPVPTEIVEGSMYWATPFRTSGSDAPRPISSTLTKPVCRFRRVVVSNPGPAQGAGSGDRRVRVVTERIFGPDRATLLAEQLDRSDVGAAVAQRRRRLGCETGWPRRPLAASARCAAWNWPTVRTPSWPGMY